MLTYELNPGKAGHFNCVISLKHALLYSQVQPDINKQQYEKKGLPIMAGLFSQLL